VPLPNKPKGSSDEAKLVASANPFDPLALLAALEKLLVNPVGSGNVTEDHGFDVGADEFIHIFVVSGGIEVEGGAAGGAPGWALVANARFPSGSEDDAGAPANWI